MTQEIETLSIEKKDIMHQLFDMKKKAGDAKADFEQSQTAKNDLESELDKLKKEQEVMKGDLAQLTSERDEYESQKVQSEKYNANLKKDIEQMSSEIEELKTQIKAKELYEKEQAEKRAKADSLKEQQSSGNEKKALNMKSTGSEKVAEDSSAAKVGNESKDDAKESDPSEEISHEVTLKEDSESASHGIPREKVDDVQGEKSETNNQIKDDDQEEKMFNEEIDAQENDFGTKKEEPVEEKVEESAGNESMTEEKMNSDQLAMSEDSKGMEATMPAEKTGMEAPMPTENESMEAPMPAEKMSSEDPNENENKSETESSGENLDEAAKSESVQAETAKGMNLENDDDISHENPNPTWEGRSN